MESILAISGDGRLLRQLRAGGPVGTVHSVFESVINLQTSSGQLVSLAACQLDNAPNTLVLNTQSMTTLKPRVGAQVIASGTRLLSPGSFTVDLAAATEWSPELPDLSTAFAHDVDALRRSASALRRLVNAEGRKGGILPRSSAGSLEDQVAQQLETATRGLMGSLRCGDLAAGTQWAGRLVGLGPGLTPSGDDFITGLAATISIPGIRVHDFLPWVSKVARDAETRTTAISWTTMSEAKEGRVRESILALFHTFAAGDPRTVRDAARKVMHIGKTSGTDLVAGVQAALHLEEELRSLAAHHS